MGTSLKVVPVAHRGFRPPSESQNPDIESLWDEPLFAALICSVGQNGTTMNNDVPTPEPTGSRPGDGHSGPAIPDITPGHSGPTHASNPGLPLRRLLMSLGDPVVDVAAAPDGLDVQVDNVVIIDPEDRVESRPGDLALLIGARGGAARRLVRALAEQGATAVAVKVGGSGEEVLPPPPGGRGRRPGDELQALRAEAEESGVALLSVRSEVRWDQLQSVCRSIVDNA